MVSWDGMYDNLGGTILLLVSIPFDCACIKRHGPTTVGLVDSFRCILQLCLESQ